MIAIDAMGGDHAPIAVINGALRAARQGVSIILFGPEHIVFKHLYELHAEWRKLPIQVVHCPDIVTMDDDPARAVLAKKNSSLVRAAHAVANGQAKALLSAGNSGALLVTSMLILGRVPGVQRPAVAGFLPTLSNSVLCLDLGANVDCKPEHLAQFALMGELYLRISKNNMQPRVGLLSNGHEPKKGNAVTRQAYQLIAQLPIDFIGNIEARDIFNDQVDVVVVDGFIGNVLLKGVQGVANLLFKWLELGASAWWQKMLLWLNKKLFMHIKQKSDYARQGGALLLGVQQPVIFAHGRSSAQAIEHAILFAHSIVTSGSVERFNKELAALLPSPVSSTIPYLVEQQTFTTQV